jgi:hypothetical protein
MRILVAIEGDSKSPEARPVAVIDSLPLRLIEGHFAPLHAIESDDHSGAVSAQAATDKDRLANAFHDREQIAKLLIGYSSKDDLQDANLDSNEADSTQLGFAFAVVDCGPCSSEVDEGPNA